jgi:hypothetical protein
MQSSFLTNRRTFFKRVGQITCGGPLLTFVLPRTAGADSDAPAFGSIKSPDWVLDVTRMAFLTPGDVEKAAMAGVQVAHGNAVWPYYPLRRDAGGLRPDDGRLLKKFVDDCHRHEIKLVLGLPPFPPVELVREHPEWRVHPDNTRCSASCPMKKTSARGSVAISVPGAII